MSKIVKIKQAQIEKIVNAIISENLGEYQPTMADEQLDEEPTTDSSNKYGIAVGPDGRHYVMNIKTGEILGSK
jgi:hypothetical protein